MGPVRVTGWGSGLAESRHIVIMTGSMTTVILIGLSLLVLVLLAFQMSSALRLVPGELRTVEPLVAWLTLVPIMGLVFLIMLMSIEVPDSLRQCFRYAANAGPPPGIPADFGRMTAVGYLVCLLLCVVPGLGLVPLAAAAGFLRRYIRILDIARRHLRHLDAGTSRACVL
jgi:hypothetical protein